MKLLKASLAVLCVGMVSLSAFAQDAYSELAGMMALQQSKMMRDSSVKSLRDMSKQMLASMGVQTPEGAKEIEEKFSPARDRMFDRMSSALSSPEAQSDMQGIFDRAMRKTYSLDEAAAMVAFYKTPVGASLLSKYADLQVNMLADFPAFHGKYLGPIMRDLMQEMAEISKKR